VIQAQCDARRRDNISIKSPDFNFPTMGGIVGLGDDDGNRTVAKGGWPVPSSV
jgi:hypothetical protein